MELKYITQENIDDSHINITSAEMYGEFKKYNQKMLDMSKIRWRFLRDFWGMWIMNAIIVPFIFILTYFRVLSPIIWYGGSTRLCLAVVIISEALLVYLVGIRKMYSWIMGFLVTLLMLPANLCYVMLAVANAVIIYVMGRIDYSIRDETGYPHFVQLRGSYKSFVKDGEVFGIEGESVYGTDIKADYVVPEDPFAKYRIRPEDDMGMLADNDINNNKE
ncbi:hypothetical protein [Ruminococcus flavefaciens]|uniref:hypothetical protein n=1 Tax=Ruminococcus flavefaciens TaxID=1265 RepID=UPI0026E9C36F|nr:hypothetical protein [Ruminococcus flavefaciens]